MCYRYFLLVKFHIRVFGGDPLSTNEAHPGALVQHGQLLPKFHRLDAKSVVACTLSIQSSTIAIQRTL